MARYRQYCPIARATEVLGARWTFLVVRNLMMGADTFTDISRGVPMMSRSMLIKRLDELARGGVLTISPKASGHGSTYRLTDAGRDLAGVIDDLNDWGARWLDVTTEDADPAFALWVWCQVQLDRSALPVGRVVVGFTFPDERPANRRYWLLVEHGDAELCYSDPGGTPDVEVVAGSLAFVDWHRGARTWTDVIGSGEVTLTGPKRLRTALPTWNLRHPVLPVGEPG
ncbi:MAG TPA: helix-turn-helix domain-containing protein [Acidimicrobiales bacterium]|nr:helix-turn-helix domain-containing protein [Acidimicrobiales bacterium]